MAHRARTSFLHSSLLLSLLCLMAHRARTSFLHSSLLLSLLCLMAHRARTSFLNSSLLLAFLSIVPQVYPLYLISFSMMRLHVVFGLPLFLFPSGVRFRTTFVMSSNGLRRTWSSYLHLFWHTKSPCPWYLWCHVGLCWRFICWARISSLFFLRLDHSPWSKCWFSSLGRW